MGCCLSRVKDQKNLPDDLTRATSFSPSGKKSAFGSLPVDTNDYLMLLKNQ